MMRKSIAMVVILAGCAAPSALQDLRSGDPERARAAAEALVGQGQAALPALREALKSADDPLARRRIRSVLARLTGQWGSDGSGILWHRSFDEAVIEAKRTGKPIFCLNLFGKFDEEFC